VIVTFFEKRYGFPMLKKFLGFMFGHPPDIFDQDGNIRHNFPPEKWTAWDNRFRKLEYDWRKHTGQERGKDLKDLK
jgi:hypothetical protein